jgi:hypothetical protein
MEHLHDRDARVEADQVGEREGPQRVGEPELRDRVDRFGRRDAFRNAYAAPLDERIRMV